MMGQGGKEWRMHSPSDMDAKAATKGIFVYLDDVDAHYEHARKGVGAEIVQAPYNEPYGRTYTARDLDGHPWLSTTQPSQMLASRQRVPCYMTAFEYANVNKIRRHQKFVRVTR